MRIVAILLLLIAFMPTGLSARVGADAPEPPAHYAMRPVGQGSLTWFMLHVYDAALWSPSGQARSEEPFALVIRYARPLEGEAIARHSIDEIERIGGANAAQRREWFTRLRAALPDVRVNDQIAGIHLPGVGTRLYLNGRLLAEIDDPAFSRAFFSIWLDPRTREPALRDALLGRS